LLLQADVVVLGTGYRNTEAQLLPDQLRRLAGYEEEEEEGQQWLYRSVGIGLTWLHLESTLTVRWHTKQEVECTLRAR
jgi:hypothetical protein